MAFSEGVQLRWEAFNRWCDEYADAHGGMKPKVEDVRKWHRENAEKVWPDSNERPSVFLAVSHNKGRRVRGHKTCEYYKRYRAGKAAEQQLAARLQPVALSGRRILAVTAAARKHNTDCARSFAKRSSPDGILLPGRGDDGEIQGLRHVDKRRRMRSTGDRLTHHHPVRSSASVRRSSSDGLSETSSWASDAGTSQDDNGERVDDCGFGVAVSLRARAARRYAPHPSYPHPRAAMGTAHTGVHITVVRRDSDGRTIQVETQAASGRPHQDFGGRHANLPCFALGKSVAPQGLAVGGGCQAFDASDSEMRNQNSSGAETDGDKCDQAQPEMQQCLYRPLDEDRKPSPHDQGQAGLDCAEIASKDWDWAEQSVEIQHPGVAPQPCRKERSNRARGKQRLLLQFSRYVLTPVGSVPVYSMDGLATSVVDGDGASVQARRTPWDSGSVENRAALICLAKDPLDLLAEAACDALDSPPRKSPGEGDGGTGVVEPLPVVNGLSGLKLKDEAVAAAATTADVPDRDCTISGDTIGGPGKGFDEIPGSSCRAHQRREGLGPVCEVRRGDDDDADSRDSRCASPIGHDEGESGQTQHRSAMRTASATADMPVKQEVMDHDQQCGVPPKPDGDGDVIGVQVQAAKHIVALNCNGGTAHVSSAQGVTGPGFASVLEHERDGKIEEHESCPQNSKRSASILSTESALLKQASTSSQSAGCETAETDEELAQALTATAAGVKLNASWTCPTTKELCAPELLVPSLSCGGSSNAAAALAIVPPAICTASLCNEFTGQSPLFASALEAEFASRAAANVTAANIAAALLHGQPARLSLNTAAGGLGLPISPPFRLPSGSSLPALTIPGPLATPPIAPPPILWHGPSGGKTSTPAGTPPFSASASASPNLTDASVLSEALAGAGAACGSAGQLLPVMRLLQMQLVTRGLDPNSCHE